VELIESYKAMVTARGWNGTAGHLGMSKSALEARVYEKKGQGMSVDTALLIQDFSGTKLFAQAVSILSGGVHIQIPQADEVDDDSLLEKFNELYASIGRLSQQFSMATADGEVDHRERAGLIETGNSIHEHIQELLGLTFAIYCRQPAAAPTIPQPRGRA
jgi:hypothetical protein